jgi:hypothetical protein
VSNGLLPQISEEQMQVIKELENNNNVIVNSVAGSGKTTCNLHIANYFVNKKILLLTYNAKLKIETRERVGTLELSNIETHSYHSFGVKYYHNTCFTDTELNDVIVQNMCPNKTFNFDIIILDESQDINPTYYNFIKKIFRDNIANDINICVLGDAKQSIFQFNKADERYLTLANNVFNFNSKQWVSCNLSRSFRITEHMSNFINKCMLDSEGIRKIISHKESKYLPKYLICNVFGNAAFEQFKYYYEELKYSANDIFILAPSVKNLKTPVKILENKIKEWYGNSINIFVPSSDESKIDPDIVKDKLIFSSFHQSKGLERKVVLVFGFDDSYFKFYSKNSNPYECPNTLYVATTRALEHLIIFHHYENKYLPFLNNNRIRHLCDFKEIDTLSPLMQSPLINIQKFRLTVGVTNLLHHLPFDVIDYGFNKLNISLIKEKQNIIQIDSKIEEVNGSCEYVADITGTAIPSYVELKIRGKLTIYENLMNEFENPESDNYKFVNKSLRKEINKIKTFKLNKITPKQLLYIVNTYDALQSKYLFRIKQIKTYDWLSLENLNMCSQRVHNLIENEQSNFEKEYSKDISIDCLENDFKLVGRVDYEDNHKIIEFKCVNELSKEHFLQLAIYSYLLGNCNKRFILYNILSEETFEISNTPEELQDIVIKLLIAKYHKIDVINDNDFIKLHSA